MSTLCSADELRGLFLFEKLTDDQLNWLCREGRVELIDSGPVYAEGESATCFYVLLEGEVVLSRQVGADNVEVNRTSDRGVYGGAFMAYLGDRIPQAYNNSMRVLRPSRFFVLDADKFAALMRDWFPMAVHLLEGLFFGTKNAQQAIGQRERLLALGSLTAGLAHELNNPAAAAVRATAALRERVAGMRNKLGYLAAGGYDRSALEALVGLQNEAAERVSKASRPRWARWRPPTPRTPPRTGWTVTASPGAGSWPRCSCRAAWTPPGWTTSRPPWPTSCPPTPGARPWTARCAGWPTASSPSC